MRFSIKNYSALAITFFTTFIMSATIAGETCVHCGKKDVEGAPGVSLNGLDKVAMMVKEDGKSNLPIESKLKVLCMKYTQIEKTEVNQMIRDLKETGYSVDDYFLKSECPAYNFAKVKTPLLQLTAEAPCGRAEYPEIVYKYYNIKRKDLKMWQEVINSKNTNGETYLDYIESLNNKNAYSTPESKKCVGNLVNFACSTGAIYSKYSDKKCTEGI